MTRKTVILAHNLARRTAMRYVADAPEGWVVTISEPKKRRIQEEKYHAMIGEIAAQSTYAGRRWDAADMKRLLVDEFAEDMRNAGTPLHHDTRVTVSEDGRRTIQLGIQTSDFLIREASNFIEFLLAWGADRGVVFTEPAEEFNPAHEPA